MRTVALYGTSLALSSIAATLAGRAGLRVVPAPELGALQPDVIIFDLAAPRSDFNIALWRARPEVLLIGVDLGSDRMYVLSGRPARVLTLENLYQAIESLPQGEVMAIKNKKHVWMAVAGIAAAAVILVCSFIWRPVELGSVLGAIGHRDVYRQPQLTDKDVGVAGQVKFTVDDVQRLLQSPEFKMLAKDSKFQKAVADGSLNLTMSRQEGMAPNSRQNLFANPDGQKALEAISGNAVSLVVLSYVIKSHTAVGLAREGKLDEAAFSGAAQKALVGAVTAHSGESKAGAKPL